MRIALTGKGGVGKTTLAGTLARLIVRSGQRVLAVDGDLNPNLAITLGVSTEVADRLAPMPADVVGFTTNEDGSRDIVLTEPFDRIVSEHAATTPDGIPLVLMGRPDHAGKG